MEENRTRERRLKLPSSCVDEVDGTVLPRQSIPTTGQNVVQYNVGSITDNKGVIIIGGEGHTIYQQQGHVTGDQVHKELQKSLVISERDITEDIAAEQEQLTALYEDATQCIPVLLEDEEGLPIGDIYAPQLIEEDLEAMRRTRRSNEPSGGRTLGSVRGVFYSGEELSRRIFLKGEAGSGNPSSV